MPALEQMVARTFGGDRQAIQLAREADREVADVDDFLHFAQPFAEDLAGLERDEFPERLLVAAHAAREATHQFAAHRRGYGAPGEECFLRGGNPGGDDFRAIDRHVRQR